MEVLLYIDKILLRRMLIRYDRGLYPIRQKHESIWSICLLMFKDWHALEIQDHIFGYMKS